ncbi:MAG: AMP-binding protein [Candidatus Microthrix sp.]|jgi:long-chain acyl-CoA synthetase|uniref:Acyl-CoA synthetase n=1 Tax=Candidatus Neomicrothrix subdominans TaxID=2954438 RepID=A0A936ND61_9ACTN|nr:AMP-dependent synthetase/ligase [Candidatus Microthrix sp.]MBK9296857.1 AMP-binding protein [Candidatus Microthrix subdominans]MBK6440509.1 AMP-binding protein [Candidatus Microthrix sp.]MBK6971341.1 AMP-binding protein [Candidatus Microthrix sp.]MBK7164170.1 AMP-binding protein [Candidatus Microthrix sp.]MBK9559119.1 AMP-binding protein [Candidatus Microthrix sp.]
MPLTDQEILDRVEGQTVPTAFMATLAEHSDLVAVRWMSEGDWFQLSFAEFAERVATAAAGLRALGVGHGDRIVIMMRNIPEFHIVDLAATFLGATPISIYNSSSADQIAYLVGDCEAKVAVLENDGFLQRFQAARDRLPALQSIVTLHGGDDDTVRWDDFMGHDPVDLTVEVTNATPDDLATVIYTSGTTGNPKGVMLSHRNIVWTGQSLRETFPFPETAGVKVMSYLPMAHIAERMTSHYASVIMAYEVICCPEFSELTTYIGAVHPQLMFGVPRVWEKVHSGITAALSADPEKEQKVAEAVEAALPIMAKMDAGTATEDEIATWNFLDDVAFSTIRELLGLDELKLAVTGAAPISPELLSWFRAIGINLCEVYGMSESSGPMTFTVEKPKAGTGGPAIPGSEVALADDGEVIFRGSNVFVGYLNQPEKTAETLIDGWLYSGDIGTIDEDGYLTIVDRKKELIVTAGGKNISPANLEAELKMIDIVGQAAAIGDQRKFVSALLVLDPEVAPIWAKKNGVEFSSLDDLAQHEAVREHIDEGVAEAMQGFNSAEAVKRWVILGDEWEPDSDVLTPTSKLKRRGILARYQDEIDSMYA